MTGITFQMLLDVDPEVYRQAANAWDRLARMLDDRADGLRPAVKKISEVWDGEAGAAAEKHCDKLRRDVESAFVPITGIAQALSQHAADLAELQAKARQLIKDGSDLHITIHSDGSMEIDPGHSNEWTARSMSSLVWRRDNLIKEAAELDAQTASRINEHAEATSGGSKGRVDRSSIPPIGTDPRKVKEWWDKLTPEQRRYLVTNYPELIGNLDGVPIEYRDIANRILLDQEKDRLSGRLKEIDDRLAYIRSMIDQGRGRELYPNEPNPLGAALAEIDRLNAERADISSKLSGLQQIEKRLNDSSLPRAYLIGLSTKGDGKVILSVGNPDESDNVLTYVPGTGSELAKSRGDIDRIDAMFKDAKGADSKEQTAVVLWLGYDAPDHPIRDAGFDKYADAAVDPLSRFQTGLRATHNGEQSFNTVLGHSYGSTVIGHTATQKGIDADALIFVGSPGVDADKASDLKGVPQTQVWATTAENDVIRRVPEFIHGNHPVDDDFGAQVFTSDPGPNNELKAHSSYWDDGNKARKNIANIATNQGSKVEIAK